MKNNVNTSKGIPLSTFLELNSNIKKTKNSDELLEFVIKTSLSEQFIPIKKKTKPKTVTPPTPAPAENIKFKRSERVKLVATDYYRPDQSQKKWTKIGSYKPKKDDVVRYMSRTIDPDNLYIEVSIETANSNKVNVVWVPTTKVYKPDPEKSRGFDPWTLLILGGLVVGGFLVAKGAVLRKIATLGWREGDNTILNLMRFTKNGTIQLFDIFQYKNRKRIEQALKQLKNDGAITAEQYNFYMQEFKNPAIYKQFRQQYVQTILKSYLKGGRKAPPAKEVAKLLPDDLQAAWLQRVNARQQQQAQRAATQQKAAQQKAAEDALIQNSTMNRQPKFTRNSLDKKILNNGIYSKYNDSKFKEIFGRVPNVGELNSLQQDVKQSLLGGNSYLFSIPVTNFKRYKNLYLQHNNVSEFPKGEAGKKLYFKYLMRQDIIGSNPIV